MRKRTRRVRTYSSTPGASWRARWPLFMGSALILAGAAIIPLMLRSANLGSTRPAHPNVLLITVDTLRWDRLGSYGATHNPTPVLDRLAAGGTRFETAIAHVPLTAPSHASILTGLTPVRHGVRDNGGFVLTEKITLASTFRAAGYATAAFVSGFPLDRRFGFAAGFQTYDDRLPGSDGPGRAAYTERRADDTTERALAWLAASAGNRPSSSGAAPPWFLWIHYFDPHAAYDPPQPWKGKMPTAYDGEVAFVDDQIGRLFGKLAQMGAESQTIVAVTADHGESLGDHNEETHGVFIYDATLRVPLILAGPGISAGSVSNVVGRGVDVMPTLVDAAGLQVPEHLDGRSLKLALEGRTMDDEGTYIESLLAERQFGWAPLRGFRDSRWKFIDAPEPELYDLLQDAAEMKNRATDAPRRSDTLAGQLEEKLKAAGTPDALWPQASMDREAAERKVAGARRNPKSGIQLINRLERGLAQVRRDPRRAIEELRAVLADDPGIAVARSQLAVALMAIGNHSGAIEQLRILAADRTASAEDMEDAIALLRPVAGMKPENGEALAALGAALARTGRPREAIPYLERAVAAGQQSAAVLNGLGFARLESGDRTGALAALRRSLAITPNQPQVQQAVRELTDPDRNPGAGR